MCFLLQYIFYISTFGTLYNVRMYSIQCVHGHRRLRTHLLNCICTVHFKIQVSFVCLCPIVLILIITELKDDRMANSINGSRYRHILRYCGVCALRKAVRAGPPPHSPSPFLPAAIPYPSPTQSAVCCTNSCLLKLILLCGNATLR